MEYLWTILALIFVFVGMAGAVLPVLPGPIISVISFVFLLLIPVDALEWGDVGIWALFALLVSLLDYVVPVWGTRKLGGTKAGVRGSVIGLVVGLFFPPLGIILGPFVGALIGEYMQAKDSNKALRSALGSFAGFLVGTGLKLMYSAFVGFYVVKYLIEHFAISW